MPGIDRFHSDAEFAEGKAKDLLDRSELQNKAGEYRIHEFIRVSFTTSKLMLCSRIFRSFKSGCVRIPLLICDNTRCTTRRREGMPCNKSQQKISCG